MKFSFLVFILLSFSAWSFDKDFTLINDRVPHEFVLLFDSLKMEVRSPSEQLRMIALCKELNDNLGMLQKEHIFMLMKTEIIKGTLEYQFDKVRRFDVNQLLISRLEENFNAKKANLSAFSKWIWQSIIAELNQRKKMGLITSNSFNPTIFEGNKRADAIRFQKYLSYLNPWIDKMDLLDAESFNKLSKNVSWSILERINDRSVLFKRYASTAMNPTITTLINIPQKLLDLKPEEIKKMQADTMPLSLSELSSKEKNEAKEDMDKVTPVDLSPISEKLSNELQNKVEESP